jgi:tetratricopeptide (TPR) repeat protein
LVRLSFYDQSFQHGLDFAEKALQLAQKLKFEKGQANSLHQIGNQYFSISNYSLSLHYYVEALKIRERISDTRGIAVSHLSIGSIYQLQGDYLNAIRYIQKAESMMVHWKTIGLPLPINSLVVVILH